MGRHESLGLCVHALDEVLQDADLDPPLPSATDLDGRQFAGADQGVGLRGGDVQGFSDVFELG